MNGLSKTSIRCSGADVKITGRYICQGTRLSRPYKIVNAVNLGGFTWTGSKDADEHKLNELLLGLAAIGYRIKVTPGFTGYSAEFRSIRAPFDEISGTYCMGPDLATAVFAATDRLVKKMAEWKEEDGTN